MTILPEMSRFCEASEGANVANQSTLFRLGINVLNFNGLGKGDEREISGQKKFDEKSHCRGSALLHRPFPWGDSGPYLIHGSLGPFTRVRVPIPNSISIGSAVLAQLMVMPNRQTHRPRNIGNYRPHLCSLCVQWKAQGRTISSSCIQYARLGLGCRETSAVLDLPRDTIRDWRSDAQRSHRAAPILRHLLRLSERTITFIHNNAEAGKNKHGQPANSSMAKVSITSQQQPATAAAS